MLGIYKIPFDSFVDYPVIPHRYFPHRRYDQGIGSGLLGSQAYFPMNILILCI